MRLPGTAVVLLTATILATSCDAPPTEPIASAPDPVVAAQSPGPAAGVPLVIVREGAGTAETTDAGAPVVDNLDDALDRVASGGTVRVLQGTYVTQDVGIRKPVTIEASDSPTIDAAGAETALRVGGIPEGVGTVTIRGLRFVSARATAIFVEAPHDGVVIEDAEFHPTTEEFGSNGVTGQGSGGRIIVRNSAFLGGNIGAAFDDGVTDALIVGNEFVGQNVESIRFGGGSGIVSARAEGNRISGCGGPVVEACILSFGGTVALVGNEISVDRPMNNSPIFVIGGDVVVQGNTITGNSDADPADPSSFLLQSGAIGIDQTNTAVISGNTIRYAFTGIAVGSLGSGSGLDNVIDHVVVGLDVNPGTIAINSSDITNYRDALTTGDPDTDLTCNWWGSPSGPTNAGAPDPSVYTPWATEPVAGTSTTTCSGGL